MKTDKIINIRNSLILLIGAAYCIIGGLLFVNFHFPYGIIPWLPLTILIVSAIILGALIKKARGAWDERTKHQFYRFLALAYGLTNIPPALLISFNAEDGMVNFNQVAGIMMLGFGVPTILFALGE